MNDFLKNQGGAPNENGGYEKESWSRYFGRCAVVEEIHSHSFGIPSERVRLSYHPCDTAYQGTRYLVRII